MKRKLKPTTLQVLKTAFSAKPVVKSRKPLVFYKKSDPGLAMLRMRFMKVIENIAFELAYQYERGKLPTADAVLQKIVVDEVEKDNEGAALDPMRDFIEELTTFAKALTKELETNVTATVQRQVLAALIRAGRRDLALQVIAEKKVFNQLVQNARYQHQMVANGRTQFLQAIKDLDQKMMAKFRTAPISRNMKLYKEKPVKGASKGSYMLYMQFKQPKEALQFKQFVDEYNGPLEVWDYASGSHGSVMFLGTRSPSARVADESSERRDMQERMKLEKDPARRAAEKRYARRKLGRETLDI